MVDGERVMTLAISDSYNSVNEKLADLSDCGIYLHRIDIAYSHDIGLCCFLISFPWQTNRISFFSDFSFVVAAFSKTCITPGENLLGSFDKRKEILGNFFSCIAQPRKGPDNVGSVHISFLLGVPTLRYCFGTFPISLARVYNEGCSFLYF